MKAIALSIVVLAFVATNAHATDRLALTCKGTSGPIDRREPREPFSIGVIINFTDKTVHGFEAGGLWFRSKNKPAKIADISETEIYFEAKSQRFGLEHHIIGTLDRVTGDMEISSTDWKGDQPAGDGTMYELKCRPTQRMF
jgi:hypothetical protein